MKGCKILFLLLILIPAFSYSQTGEIRGFVYEEATSEPSIYTSVYLKGTTYGAQTNLDGFFSISRIPPGTYELLITSIGFDTVSDKIEIKKNDLVTRKFYLKKSSIQIKEVEVSAEDQSKKTDVRISVNKITPKEIRQVPAVGGEPDLAQYLQVVPGVVFSGDQGGQLYIRGGTPIQNKLLLDGMIIYNPFHSIGLYTVIDADIIRGADIYTGGFNAEYGDRISSIMDITTRDGNKKRLSGKASANTFSSKVILEGPLKKEKENAEGSSSFLLTGKTSYLDKTSETFYEYADSAGLPYSFTDLYGKVSFNSSSGSKFNVFGFHFKDDVDYEGAAEIGWKSTGFGTNFVLVPTGSAVMIDGNFAYSGYDIDYADESGGLKSSSINGFNLGLNFNYFFGKNEFHYGVEVLGFSTDYTVSNITGSPAGQEESTTEIGAFLKYKKAWSKVILEPGLRLNYYSSLSEFSPEPRIGIKYNVGEKFRLKGAAGLYSQNLLSTSSDRDVVNLFYGFLSGPDNLPDEFRGEEVTSRLQKAQHLIAGFELDLPFFLSLNIEGYIKNFSQLINTNRDKIYPDDSQHNDKPDYLKKDYIIEQGTARGFDATLKYENRNLFVWLVYSLGFNEREDESRTYEPSFDRRHNVNLVASLKFGPKDLWQASARFNFGSPFPFTQTQGFYESLQLPDGIGTDINTQNGNLDIYYGDLNKGRLSYYHRLDVSIQKTFILSKYSNLEISAGATNLYNRENIFYVSRTTDERIYQLPIMPTIGISLTF
jgi:hypothetical protein